MELGLADLRIGVAWHPLRLSVHHRGRGVLRSSEDGHIRGGLRIPFLSRKQGAWALAFALESGEAIYGLGEKFGGLNRRGGLFTSWNEDAWGVNGERSYKNVPLLWSTRGWGLFLHTTARAHHGVGFARWSHRSYIVVVEDEGIDVFLVLGSPAEILEAYTLLTGKAPLVPRWSLGVWWSRCFYKDEAEALDVARRLRAKGIPGDVLVLDGRAWLKVETRCALDWDRDRYPNPAGFVRRLKRLGFRLCLWEYPYVSIHHPLFAELAAKGYFLCDEQGNPYVYHWDPEPFGELLTPLPPSGLLDFTRAEAWRWWQERHQELFQLGVDVMKTDFGEQIPEDAVASNGDSGRFLHNAYALLYNRCVWECSPHKLVLARSSYAGGHRYPVVWGGDPQADWEGLASSIRGGLSWGLSGGPYYAHDIGGFYGTPDPELYVRWLQAAIFFSHVRFHGTSPREPWFFGKEAEKIVLQWLRLRMRLVPYLEASLYGALAVGQPLAKAMPLAFPEDRCARGFEEQFLVGQDLLVVPVLQPGGAVEAYLPGGKWFDLWSGKAYVGPDLLRLKVGLEKIPVFAREGAVIPIGNFAQRAEEVDVEGVLLVGETAGRGREPGAKVLGALPGDFSLALLL
nr:glycoside hydrolase family 31 protein [Thermus sediminis]